MAKKQEKKLFGFLDRRTLKPDAAAEDTRPTLKRYFVLLGRRFGKLLSLNIMMIPMILPLLIGIWLWVGIATTPSESTFLFPQIYGADLIDRTPASVFLLDLFGSQTFIPAYNVTGTYIGIGICALVTVVTFGWQNCGATYILRGMVRGDAVFLWSDYFYAIKRNLLPGFILGVIDSLALFLLGFDLAFFWGQTGTFMLDLGFFVTIALIILYYFMRYYLYLLLITFELSLRKIFKNALIFAVLGFKRNIMALIGIALITGINVVLFFLLMPLGIAIPLILPLVYYLSFTAFTSAYAAYPIIDRYMIEPYRKQHSDEEEEPEENGGNEATDAE